MTGYGSPKGMGNHPSSGLCPEPNRTLEGNKNPKLMKFADLVAPGESPNKPDLYVQNANGVSSAFGKDKGRQYTWGDGDAGNWNDNKFDDSNMTGM